MVAVKCQEQNCVTKTREQRKKRLKRITENQSLSAQQNIWNWAGPLEILDTVALKFG